MGRGGFQTRPLRWRDRNHDESSDTGIEREKRKTASKATSRIPNGRTKGRRFYVIHQHSGLTGFQNRRV